MGNYYTCYKDIKEAKLKILRDLNSAHLSQSHQRCLKTVFLHLCCCFWYWSLNSGPCHFIIFKQSQTYGHSCKHNAKCSVFSGIFEIFIVNFLLTRTFTSNTDLIFLCSTYLIGIKVKALQGATKYLFHSLTHSFIFQKNICLAYVWVNGNLGFLVISGFLMWVLVTHLCAADE
jgi:hypothetical protein